MLARKLRCQAVEHMLSNLTEYRSFSAGDGVNSDLPDGMRYSSLEDRISSMSQDSTFVGEFEVDATAKAAHCTIIVQAEQYKRTYGIGEKKFSMRFTQLGNGSGHYDCLIEE